MAKDAQVRLDDSIAYIRAHIDLELSEHVRGLIAGHETAISQELHLGTRWDVFASAQSKDAKTQQRHALRALLLCQRVYFSDLWPCLFGTVSERMAHNWLPQDWKDQSTRFWKDRTELEIREALRMFIATTDNQNYVANAAANWRPCAPGLPPYLTTTRATFTGTRLTDTCYDGVMLWLFKSGIVSLRWLLRYRGANTVDTLTEAFGPGFVLWNGDFGADDHLRAVPRGHVVHMYENPESWRGHWMISLGNGRSAGVNNNSEEPPVPRDYCTALTLDKQFLDFEGGTAIVIDPVTIPGRF